MSQRQFPNRRQDKKSSKVAHSQKSASSSQFLEHRKKAQQLITHLNHLIKQRDFINKQIDYHQKQGKLYEAQEWMDMVLEEKAMYELQVQRAKIYNRQIIEIEKMIDKLHLVHSVGLKKAKNYARMKVKQPPSDNQD